MIITELKMLVTQSGSRDGRAAERFLAGVTYPFTSAAREQELAQVFLREKWAEVPTATNVDTTPPLTPEEREYTKKHPVMRLPLLDEYLKAGYHEETYQKMIECQTAEAVRLGRRVEIRAVTPEETAAADAELKRAFADVKAVYADVPGNLPPPAVDLSSSSLPKTSPVPEVKPSSVVTKPDGPKAKHRNK